MSHISIIYIDYVDVTYLSRSSWTRFTTVKARETDVVSTFKSREVRLLSSFFLENNEYECRTSLAERYHDDCVDDGI
ncbi:MAG: hypothetical protein E4H14_03975 [Candidatus Thorarchaeota archaeon]|nr:MAG: hypothetical protein E4H14_03975 [Candidatus Thorarchaeota archaeon]